MPGSSNVYRFGPFELAAPAGRLYRGATRGPLPGPHAAILPQLVSHPGEVLSKNALAQAAWQDAAVTDNSVDQAISRLRRTLANNQDRTPYIETVKGRGYRFGAAIDRAQRHERNDSFEAQLKPFLLLRQGEADLDTLDRDAIVRARRAFESTRVDLASDEAALDMAVDHASKGCALVPSSADAWSTLAFVLCLNGDPVNAEAAALKAIDLDPLDWRHALRLSYVCWGEARMRGAGCAGDWSCSRRPAS